MAVVAISALPASTVLAGTDILPAVVGGITKKITASNLRTQLFGLGATDPLSIGILTAVGNSTITGTLSGVTTLTATSGLFSSITQTAVSAGQLILNTSSGAVTDNNLVFFQRGGATKWRLGTNNSGTNSDAFEIYNEGAGVTAISIANSTRIVTFASGLVVTASGLVVVAGGMVVTAGDGQFTAGNLIFGAASARIIPGVTQIAIRNNANSADNFWINDAGQVFTRSTLTVGGGGFTVTGGQSVLQNLQLSGTPALVIATAVSRIQPGATSLSFRNNANSADNLIILDNGDSTFSRGNLTLTLGNFIITGVAGTMQIGGNQVVGARLVGYTNAWTGAAANLATAYDASTITLPQLAARVRALQESITTHGLIGP